ncbi:uncharacterized protein VTP21DRAFT_5239 [Calcarisporiella thermophila]|uniref:uncharacterized protein n=1 Tax=Calcarisporiella thermophila TaxID=911321 RepID=UPI0037431219
MATEIPSITLYSCHLCPFAQRVRIALDLLEVPHEVKEVELYPRGLRRMNKPAWYLEANPDGKVPSLKVGDKLLKESLNIVEYLLEAFGKNTKFDQPDPVKKAQARFFTYFFLDETMPAFYRALAGGEKLEPEWNLFLQRMKRVNQLLEEYSEEGPYFFGAHPTYADIACAPHMGRLFSAEVLYGKTIPRTSEFARVLAYKDTLAALPAFKKTMAPSDELLELYDWMFVGGTSPRE